MKKRSEVSALKKRSEPKTSAAARTLPIPIPDFTGGVPMTVTCEKCEETVSTDGLEVRADGTPECPECGALIKGIKLPPSTTPRKDAPKPKAVPEPSSQEERPPKATLPLPKAYCNQCGAEWLRVNERPFPSCGHTDGFVDDPRKAKKWDPPAGHALPDPPRLELVKNTPQVRTEPKPLTENIPPIRMYIDWGKSTFPYAPYSSFSVGPFVASIELSPTDNRVDAARSMMADLKQIATEAFESQLEWYSSQFNRLPKD